MARPKLDSSEKKEEAGIAISISKVQLDSIEMFVVGTRPLVLNRLANKGMQDLLFPKGKKNEAEKAQSLKHDPVAEFRSSPHVSKEPKAPTLLMLPSTAFKGALRSAALDTPGAKKSQIGRLTYIEGDYLPVYGIPQMMMSTVRNSDAARTPDIRSRVVVPRWATRVVVTFVSGMLNHTSVVNLAGRAGLTIGVGDWRAEKGSGTYGQFRIASRDDPELQEILKQGRRAQEAAMASPICYDEETENLLTWFLNEAVVRGRAVTKDGVEHLITVKPPIKSTKKEKA